MTHKTEDSQAEDNHMLDLSTRDNEQLYEMITATSGQSPCRPDPTTLQGETAETTIHDDTAKRPRVARARSKPPRIIVRLQN